MFACGSGVRRTRQQFDYFMFKVVLGDPENHEHVPELKKTIRSASFPQVRRPDWAN